MTFIRFYNQTTKLFGRGVHQIAHTYKVKLLTAATFNPADTTLAATGGTEVANANGYVTGGTPLTNVVVNTDPLDDNDALFDADDATWTGTTGPISASYAILYNASVANSPPILFIDFDGVETALAGVDFRIIWHPDGIIRFLAFDI